MSSDIGDPPPAIAADVLKKKKTKEQRACPRRHNHKKKTGGGALTLEHESGGGGALTLEHESGGGGALTLEHESGDARRRRRDSVSSTSSTGSNDLLLGQPFQFISSQQHRQQVSSYCHGSRQHHHSSNAGSTVYEKKSGGVSNLPSNKPLGHGHNILSDIKNNNLNLMLKPTTAFNTTYDNSSRSSSSGMNMNMINTGHAAVAVASEYSMPDMPAWPTFPSPSFELSIEDEERRRWSQWAKHAAESERRRRVEVMRALHDEEAQERRHRQRQAAELIAREQHDRVSLNFLDSLAASHWFTQMVSTNAYQDDYELVCPYFRMGCSETCRRSTVTQHLKQCRFAHNDAISAADADIYEVMCPYSRMGCGYSGSRAAISAHIDKECKFRGQTREEELEERLLLKQSVILECEQERLHRLLLASAGVPNTTSAPGSGSDSRSLIFFAIKNIRLAEALKGAGDEPLSSPSTEAAAAATGRKDGASSVADDGSPNKLQGDEAYAAAHSHIHIQLADMWQRNMQRFAKRRGEQEALISSVRRLVTRLWPYSSVEPFGSFATDFPSQSSDVDLVVSFTDAFQTLIGLRGAIPLLHVLAEYLSREAPHLIAIKQVLLHARVPIIKAEAYLPGGSVLLDISLDGPDHSGLAAAALLRSLTGRMPLLGPLVLLFKDFLKSKGLCDSHNGGLSSYGATLMVISSVLKCMGDQRSIAEADRVDRGGPSAGAVDACTPPRPLGSRSIDSSDSFDGYTVAVEDPHAAATASAKFMGVGSPSRASAFKYGRFCSQYNLLKQKKQMGMDVAAKILDSYSDGHGYCGEQQLSSGLLVSYLLHEFGEEMQSGRHGYSVRFGWFRFNINEDEPFPHPHATDPLLIEDPINVTNNVAKNCYKAQAISRVFKEAGRALEAAVSRGRIEGFEGVDILVEIFGSIPCLSV